MMTELNKEKRLSDYGTIDLASTSTSLGGTSKQEPTSRWKRFKAFLPKMVVEPLAMLYFTGFGMFGSVQLTTIYFKVCTQTYANFSLDCDDLEQYPQIQDSVQSQASLISLFAVLASLPSLPINVLMSAWSDRYGRKFSLIVGVMGVTFYTYSYLVVDAITDCPLWVLFILIFFASFTGMVTNVQASFLMYLNDIVPNKDTLTVRIAIIGALWSLGYVVGGSISGTLLVYTNTPSVIFLGQCLITVSAVYILFFVEDVPPELMWERHQLDESEELIADIMDGNFVNVDDEEHLMAIEEVIFDSSPDGGTGAAAAVIRRQPGGFEATRNRTRTISFAGSIELITDVAKTISAYDTFKSLAIDVKECLTKKRAGHRKLHITLGLIAFFLYVTVDQGLDIQYVYIYHRPRTFTPQLTSYFSSAQSMVQMIGSIAASVILKKLQWSDISITLVSMISSMAMLVTLALATTNLLVFLSTIPGIISIVGASSLESFLCQQVDVNETGKILAIVGISSTFAQIMGNCVFNPIYNATLTWWDGFVFIFVAFLVLIAFLCIFCIFLDIKCGSGKVESFPEIDDLDDDDDDDDDGDNDKNMR